MIILSDTNDVLRAQLINAHVTTAPEYVVSWQDMTTTTSTPGVSVGNVTGVYLSVSFTNIVAAPASSTQRTIHQVSIYNRDTFPNQILIYTYDGTTNSLITGAWLQINEALHYESNRGWYVTNKMGDQKSLPSTYTGRSPMNTASNFPWNPWTGCRANLYTTFYNQLNTATLRTIPTTTTEAVYIGPYQPETMKGAGAARSFQLRFRVTTLASTITWAEVALYMGSPNGGSPVLHLIDWTDVSAVVNSNGYKTVTLSLDGTNPIADIPPGIGLWAAFGNQASTPMTILGITGPRIEVGASVTATIRPSTAGSTVTFTELSGIVVPWCTLTSNGP